MNAISVSELQSSFVKTGAPIVVDARSEREYRAAGETLAGALRRDPQAAALWAPALPRAARVVVYGGQDGAAARGVAQALHERGVAASWLEGGLGAWKAREGALDRKPAGGATRWVTRERPKIDRIACPWLIARFVDREAEFLYVPPREVLDAAKARDAVPYDVPGVHFTHEGGRCSFDAFVAHYRLGADPALERLAAIVRGADTARPELAPQAAGLAAVSLGLSRVFADDHDMLAHGMVLYDALYAWCREGQDEVHTWNPQAYR
jgi:rhodanese-related sulfurtransferase